MLQKRQALHPIYPHVSNFCSISKNVKIHILAIETLGAHTSGSRCSLCFLLLIIMLKEFTLQTRKTWLGLLLGSLVLFSTAAQAAHIRSDGNGGYYTPDGHVRSDGNGGFYTREGHIRSDGNGGYYTPNGHLRSDGNGGLYTPNGHVRSDGNGGFYTRDGHIRSDGNDGFFTPY